jgi:hypothetical protein
MKPKKEVLNAKDFQEQNALKAPIYAGFRLVRGMRIELTWRLIHTALN